jgi:hypothetical protein
MRAILDTERPKDAQVSVRISAMVDSWLRRRAGKDRSKADVVRELIEAEIAREEAARLREMFDAAAAELSNEDREDRDLILGAFADRE